jgi:hypothetical protein
MLWALDESGDSPSSSWGGAGKEGRLLTREREAETLERERERDRVTPVAGACSPPGLKELTTLELDNADAIIP